MMKLILAGLGNTGIALAMVAAVDNVLGLPIGTSWWDGFVIGYGFNVIMGSAVSSMVEPDEHSGRLYVFVFRFGHLLFNRGTSYFAHHSVWSQFFRPAGTRTRADDQNDQGGNGKCA